MGRYWFIVSWIVYVIAVVVVASCMAVIVDSMLFPWIMLTGGYVMVIIFLIFANQYSQKRKRFAGSMCFMVISIAMYVILLTAPENIEKITWQDVILIVMGIPFSWWTIKEMKGE